VTPAGIVVEEIAPGLTLAEIQAVTEPKLIFPALVGQIDNLRAGC